MVEEEHEDLLEDKGDDIDNYPAEWEALVSMLRPEYQREFRERRGGLDG